MAPIRSAVDHITQVAIIALLFVVYVAVLSVKTVVSSVKRRLTGASTPVDGVRARHEP